MTYSLKDFEDLLKPYGNTWSFGLGAAGIVVGLGTSVYFYRRSHRDSFANDQRLAALATTEHLLSVADGNQAELARLRNELAAIRSATPQERREHNAEVLAALESRYAPELVKKARRALLQGQTKVAEDLFRRILTKEPEFSAAAHYNLGLLAENRFDFTGARGHYREAATAEPRNGIYLAAAGRLAVRFENFEEAEDFLTRVLGMLSPDGDEETALVATVLNGLGRVRHQQVRYPEAEAPSNPCTP